ncbi:MULTISPECIES: serine aminopeptidase domain-containing protein [unclassified Cellulophaga]|uniref:serine aminopeptidase domain-containing protein n=1 Tax=unclassified Cellulophaga TaxID=2634405 RepID=UPI0026E3AE7C|nr:MULTISPECIES: alpha/beta hydrolase [unclassified Cellulophaga]MDO6490195.1 alpha/beta hydrolase [Cellulophaga sp. 2_MG-2023]MDO6494611.1 alpha/beta hydrolase [Cellulophaga sp. 3_MG-2023]
MKKTFLLILLFCFAIVSSQNIYDYEKEISNKEYYDFKEIDFENTNDNLKLSGTLITPKTVFEKIVIIVPGSGRDTRHSHFVLAEEFLKNNIAVYRFDERGIGKSEGDYSELAGDLSTDLSYALKELQKQFLDKKFGIIGHSLGGIATLNVINNDLDFVILIETPIIKNGAFLVNQFERNYESSIPEVMRKEKTKTEITSFLKGYIDLISKSTPNSCKKEIKKYIRKKGFNKRFIVLLKDTFLVEMARTNLEDTVKDLSIKTLYLTGTKDKIINHKQEVDLVKSFRNPNIEIREFDSLNHYLTNRNGKVGSSLYEMDKEPLNMIINWIIEK